MSCSKFPHMFTPMTIKGVTFKNRVFASPITTNRIVDHGYPTPEGIDVYETKSRGGFAEVTVTESFIDHEYAWRHEHGLDVWSNPMTTFHMESIMTLTEAINVFLHKAVLEGGLPFDVRQPRYNAETEAAMREARAIMSGKVRAESYDSAAAMFAALDE